MNRPAAHPLDPPHPSPRVLLARVARAAIDLMPGIAATAGGAGQWVTGERSDRVLGVVAVAAPGGRYELELHLVVAWPPPALERLADEVRRRVRAAARGAGLGEALDEIQVHIEDVEDPFQPSLGEGAA